MYTQFGNVKFAEPVIAPVKPTDARVLDALYTHSPSGLGQLAAPLGFDPRVALGELVSAGKVVYRQVGEITVYALTGALGG